MSLDCACKLLSVKLEVTKARLSLGGRRDRGEELGRTFDCRIILVDKVTLYELDSQARFAHTTAADHHQLVLPEKLLDAKCRQCKSSVL